MNKRITLLLLVSFFMSMFLTGQTKYYKNKENRIIDSLAYSKLKAETLKGFRSISPNAVMKEELNELYNRNDSLVYSFKWDISMDMKKENETSSLDTDKYIGKLFPIRDLITLDNKKIGLNDLKGKPTLINFWFTTCIPCVEEIPVLNKIKNELKDSVNFIAITFEKKEIVEKYLKKYLYNFVQVVDAESFITALGFKSFPKNVLLDKEGKVISIESGIPFVFDEDDEMIMGKGEEFKRRIKQLL